MRGRRCDDGDACTVRDACDAGTCVSGVPRDCDDGLRCTVDSCDSATGCINTDVNGSECALEGGDACEAAGGNCPAGICEGCVDFICGPGTFEVCPETDPCNPSICTGINDEGIGTCGTAPALDGAGCSVDGAPGICEGGSCNTSADGCPTGGDLSTALNHPVLTLSTAATCFDDCVSIDGDELVVTVRKGASIAAIRGVQFFLTYDNVNLDFLSISPAGGTTFNFQLFEAVDEAAGTIAYAVGPNPGSGTGGSLGAEDVAVIRFLVLDSGNCADVGGVLFDMGHNPPTRFADASGNDVSPACLPGNACQLDSDCDGGTCSDGFCDNGQFDEGACPLDLPRNITLTRDGEKVVVDGCGIDGEISVAGGCDGSAASLPDGALDGLSASGGCGDVSLRCAVNGVPVLPSALGDVEFGEGSSAVRCTAVDACGNSDTCNFNVENAGGMSLDLNVELSPTIAAGEFTRCFDVEVAECGTPGNLSTISQSVLITINGPEDNRGHGSVTIPLPAGNWECVTVSDPLHTLSSSCLIECIDGQLTADFKGAPEFNESCHWLVGGNLNGDSVIDILDFTIWAGSGATAPANTACGDEGPNADINGDGQVNIFDFTFILVNFFDNDKEGCDAACNGTGAAAIVDGGARDSVTVRQLMSMGLGDAARAADVNGDGVVDMTDVTMVLNGENGPEKDRNRGRAGRTSSLR